MKIWIKSHLVLILLWTMIIVYVPPAECGINLKNGNFYVSYTDMIIRDGPQVIAISRTYNSKSTHSGLFGYGWGSDFETYLTFPPDGRIIAHENGGGALTNFHRKQGSAAMVKSSVDTLINAMARRGLFVSEISEKSMRTRLNKDAEFRYSIFQRYRVIKTNHDVNTRWISNERGHQEIYRTSNGYTRKTNQGTIETFNKEGKLIQIYDPADLTHLKLIYDHRGRLRLILSSGGKVIEYKYKGKQRQVSTISSGLLEASYSYKGEKLTKTSDVNENNYRYEYDDNYNMTVIHYNDDTKKIIIYDEKQFASKITSRFGSVKEYEYGSDPQNPSHHYWTIIKRSNNDTDQITMSRYEYWIGVIPDTGVRFTKRIRTEINGTVADTTYNQQSLPLRIVRGDNITTFQYDGGLLREQKSSTGEFKRLEYHPVHRKITKVTNKNGSSTFQYDDRGRLTVANKGQTNQVILSHNHLNQITKMETATDNLTFQYNLLGKPTKITLKNVGEILISYDSYGEITNVDSGDNNNVARKVIQTYQDFLSIVKPAGIDLGL